MKKNLNFILILVIVLLIKITDVNSLNDYNSGSGSTGTTTQSGSYNQVTGVRVAVIDINGNLVDGTHVVDVISRKDSLNNNTYNVFSSQATKIQYWKGTASINNTKKLAYSNGTYSTNNNVINASDVLGEDDFGNYITSGSNTSLSDILKNNTYSNLKKIVKQTGYTCLENPSYDKCNSNQYIVIEAMVQAGDYILTGYEMTRQFKHNSSYRRIYINMAKTIYVDETISGFSGINVCNISDLSNNGQKSYNAMSFLNEGCGIGLYNVTNIIEIPEPEPEPTTGTLKISKTNNLGNNVTGAKFSVYKNTCDGAFVEEKEVSNGTVTFELDPGTYCVKETYRSTYYETNTVQQTVTITAGIETTVSFENMLTCQYYLDDIVGTDGKATTITEKENLIKLYRGTYATGQGNYSNYNGLLKFYEPSCQPISCDYVLNKMSCTNGWLDRRSGSNLFSQDDISCYNDTITIADKEYYCLTDFSFISPIEERISQILKLNSANPFSNFSGRFLLLHNSDDTILNAYVHKHCFLYDYPKDTSKQQILDKNSHCLAGRYSDYVKSFNWINQDIKNDLTSKNKQYNNLNSIDQDDCLIYDPPSDVSMNNSYNVVDYDWVHDNYTYVFMKTVGYTFKDIYLQKGTGEYSYTPCENCLKTAGLLTKFSNKSGSTVSLDFEFIVKGERVNESYVCEYNPKQQIIKTDNQNKYKLQLEFRSFTVGNAFPGKNGNQRRKGSNWNIFNLDYNKDTLVNLDDLTLLEQAITNGEYIDLKYDINWDLEVNKFDVDLIKTIINKYINNGEDTYAEELLSHRPNSYGYISKSNTTVTTPKYVIELTPADIKDIRKYNKNTSYDDYNFTCDESGNKCTSNYLTTLQTKGVLTINNSSKR